MAADERRWDSNDKTFEAISDAPWRSRLGNIGPLPGAGGLGLRARRHEVWRQGRALTEEVLLHLFDDELLRFRVAQVQPVLVHEDLHVLEPQLPGLFRDVLVDALAEGVPFEGNVVEPGHLALELDAEDLSGAGLVLFDRGHASTTHAHSIAQGRGLSFGGEGAGKAGPGGPAR